MIPILLAEGQVEFLYVWSEARPEGKAIIIVLVLFSIFAWSVMAAKSMQIRRARKLNRLFDQEFRQQKSLMDIFKRNIQVDGCPLYTIYAMGNRELSDCQRHHKEKGGKDEDMISLKSMERQACPGTGSGSGITPVGVGFDSAGDRGERCSFSWFAGDGVGGDERVRQRGKSTKCAVDHHCARCGRGFGHDGCRPAGRDSVDVRLQLVGP